MTQWGLAAAIAKLPDIDKIVVDLVTRNRAYKLDEEDIKYLESMRYLTRE